MTSVKSIRLINAHGQVVLESKEDTFSNISTTGLQVGIYVVQLVLEDGRYSTKKIVIY